MAGTGNKPQLSVGTALLRMATQTQQDFELDFFSNILQRNPNLVDVLKVHAKNLALAKRHEEGAMVDAKITTLRPNDSLAHYNLACSYVLTNRLDEALAMLRKAVELGYRDFRFMQQDADLSVLRQDPRFTDLIREFKKRSV